jgi:heme-degrading monooxygenase HmoA
VVGRVLYKGIFTDDEPMGGRPMIARIWSGAVRTTDADEYATYIRETGFGEYGRTAGNRGAWLLRRDDADSTEFLALSLWDGVDAIHAFAGEDIESAVLYPEDERYLIGGESRTVHYDVVEQIPDRAG